MDLATFWDCHRRAFAHFGGVPGTLVYDRTKTVIRHHVPPGLAVPGKRVQLQIHPDPDGDGVGIPALGVDGGGWLATHPRATRRGTWMIDQAHWDGLPDGHTRATTTETPPPAMSIRSTP